MLIQVENEWKEALYQWNENNVELKLEKELLRELSTFADTYEENSDYAVVRQKAADQWIKKQSKIENAGRKESVGRTGTKRGSQ